MSISYRHTIKNNKKFKLNLEEKYVNSQHWKPLGFWYQINGCGISDFFGQYIYNIKLKNNILNKPKGILSLKKTEEILDFHKKYSVKYSQGDFNTIFIKWSEVAKLYGGIEIKNYQKIKKELIEKGKTSYELDKKYTWIEFWDFSSGCIWDLNLVKDVYFVKKISTRKNSKSPRGYQEDLSNIRELCRVRPEKCKPQHLLDYLGRFSEDQIEKINSIMEKGWDLEKAILISGGKRVGMKRTKKNAGINQHLWESGEPIPKSQAIEDD